MHLCVCACLPIEQSSALLTPSPFLSAFPTPLSLSLSQQSSLLKSVEPNRSSALNEKPDHRLQDILSGPSGGKWLESDADEQLLIHLSVSFKFGHFRTDSWF